MGMDAAIQAELRTIIDAALRGELDEDAVARVYELGVEATRAVMLAVNARLAELASKAGFEHAPGPHTPSASIPPYAKPSAPTRGRKKPGARAGHKGRRRPTPEPDERIEVEELTRCPECGGRVMPGGRKRDRYVY